MGKDVNIAAQERFAEGVNTGNFDVFDEVVSPDVVDHDPAPEQGPGPEGFKDMFRTLRSAFPDMEVTPEHMIATEVDVALAYTIAGTHEGEFLGVAPTGKRITARGVQIGRKHLRLGRCGSENGSVLANSPSQEAMGFSPPSGQQLRYCAELRRFGGLHRKDRRHAQDGAGYRQVRVSELVHRAQ
jgi:steroid delta-isomerase-like uncharacterized protein